MPEESDDEKRKRLAHELASHDRLAKAAAASRNVPTDAVMPAQEGGYTTFEARDRAAHTPPSVEVTRNASPARPWTPEEEALLKQSERDLAEIHPTPDDWERSYKPGMRPDDAALRQQYDDFMGMYHTPKGKEAPENMTPEQQANLNKAIGNNAASIGSASDVTGKPVPNDPTPLEKAREIAQQLQQKHGVEMEK